MRIYIVILFVEGYVCGFMVGAQVMNSTSKVWMVLRY